MLSGFGDERIAAGGGALLHESCLWPGVFGYTAARWALLTRMEHLRAHAPTIVFQGRLLVIGGQPRNAEGCTTTVEAYEAPLGSWTSLPQLNLVRIDCAAAVVERSLWVTGGEAHHVTMPHVERLHAGAEEWEIMPSLRQPQRGLGVGYAEEDV